MLKLSISKIPKRFYHFGSWVDHLNRLKQQSHESLDEKDRLVILRQKTRIISSLLIGSFAIVFCAVILCWFASIILRDNRTQKAPILSGVIPEDTGKIVRVNLEQFEEENIKIYSRIKSKSPLLYALAKDISEGKITREEKIIATYLYLHEKISTLRDDLPKPLFYFPEEVLEEQQGSCSEIAVLASAIFYYMGIETELVESEERLGICITDVDILAYQAALKRFLPEHVVLFGDKSTVSKNFPIKFELPDRFSNLALRTDINASNPVDIWLIGKNETDAQKDNRFIGIKNSTFDIQYQPGSALIISTKAQRAVELIIKIIVQRETIKELLEQDMEGKSRIYYDFGGDMVASLSGKNPFQGKNIKVYPSIP